LLKPKFTDFSQQLKFNQYAALSAGVDWQDPLSIYLKIYSPYSFILESVSGPEKIARYSWVGYQPLIIVFSKNGYCWVDSKNKAKAELNAGFFNPLNYLEKLFSKFSSQISNSSEKMGAFGYLSYDLGRWIEKLPETAKDDLNWLDYIIIVPQRLFIFDHLKHQATAVVIARRATTARESYRLATKELLKMSRINSCPDVRLPTTGELKSQFRSNFTPLDFQKIVRKAKEYIYAGDIYQVNLSQRLEAVISAHPLNLYCQLREINPSPFAGFFNFGSWQLVGCSPERLVKLSNGQVDTRPIAGTIRRGSSPGEDNQLKEKLVSDIKERAEHLMLVDLERNDIGRVCQFGSVRVDELMITESYSHVSHIVSNITGQLLPGKNQFDLIRACFPGGTITGCPKVRAMEIIEELEPVRRGPYTGSMGYFGFNGDLDLNIIIRTLLVKKGIGYVQAGAGIVADSDPEREYWETLHKAKALVEAAKSAKRRSYAGLR
jgi:aminodeoxychorismate synthase component I